LAITLNVYVEPFVNPVTVTGEVVFEATYIPQLVYAVYEEIAPPPTQVGAENATDADEFRGVPAPIVGALATFRAS
jgi:hypothetical protein